MYGWFFLGGFALALVLSLLLTRWLRGHAPHLGLVDHPGDGRRSHARPTAVVGGIAIFLAIATTVLLLATAASFAPAETSVANPSAPWKPIQPVLLGATAMHLLGIWDDLKDLSPRAKFLCQVAIAAAAFVGGLRMTSLNVPLLGSVEFGVWASLLLSVLWLVGITNAFNLVDGADGVAAGAALMATVSMIIASLVLGNHPTALILVVTAGAVLGFLHFNFPPATVFLGDGGSLFLGFLLAGLGLASSAKTATVISIFIPVVAFGLPVLDTLLVMVRRFLRGEKLTKADRGHIHHRLIDLGHSPRQVLLILYGVCGLFALSSLIILSADERLIGAIFVIVGVVVWFGVQRLRIPELLELRSAIDRGVHQRHLIARNIAIRDTVRRIEDSGDVQQVFRELADMLDASDFHHAEIWLAGVGVPSGAFNVSTAQLIASGGGYVWYSSGAPCSPDLLGRCWEIKLPLVTATGRQLGRLTLRRAIGRHMPPDVQLIADRLLPEVCGLVERISLAAADNGPGSGSSPPRTRPPAVHAHLQRSRREPERDGRQARSLSTATNTSGGPNANAP